MISTLKYAYRKATYKYSDDSSQVVSDNEIRLFWWKDKANLGDALNLDLVEKLSKKKVLWSSNNSNCDYYTAVGSVLQLANNKTTVWGSGLISNNAKPLYAPKKIFAVRGPMTRELLDRYGISAPKVYGDPALLLPMFYNANYDKKYKIGIIPHFVDKNSLNLTGALPDYISVIDIETTDVQSFINKVCECEVILSSSLHGIIIADAYGIPSARVSFTGNITGGDFKFQDYSLTVGRSNFKSINLSSTILDAQLLKISYELGSINCDELLESCPFYSEKTNG